MNDDNVNVRPDAFDDAVDGRGRLNPTEVCTFDSVKTPKKFGLNKTIGIYWHCCMCCNPANWRVDFEEWSAYKIQLLGIE